MRGDGNVIADHTRFADHVAFLLPHCRQHRRVIDGGSHLGRFAQHLAEHFVNTMMFEPNPLCWPILAKTALAFDEYSFFPYALGDEQATVILQNADDSSRDYYFFKEGAGPGLMKPLDLFGWDDVDLIKLNIEGAELLALRGAEQTIRKTWPAIFIEEKGFGARFGDAPGEMAAFLNMLGYARIGQKKHMYLYVRTKSE